MATANERQDLDTMVSNTVLQSLIPAGWLVENMEYQPADNSYVIQLCWGYTPAESSVRKMTINVRRNAA